jgi:hypothetical protein
MKFRLRLGSSDVLRPTLIPVSDTHFANHTSTDTLKPPTVQEVQLLLYHLGFEIYGSQQDDVTYVPRGNSSKVRCSFTSLPFSYRLHIRALLTFTSTKPQVLGLVANFLDGPSLSRCARVSKECYAILNPILWSNPLKVLVEKHKPFSERFIKIMRCSTNRS